MAAAAPPPAVNELGRIERDEYEERSRFFTNFLNSNRMDWEKRITGELSKQQVRIPLALEELDAAEPGISNQLLKNPVKFLLPWEDALLGFVREIDEKFVSQLKQPLKLDIQGAFGRNHVTPRGVTSATLQQLLCVEGVVIKAGITSPKLMQSMHITKEEGPASREAPRVQQRDHRDATSFVNNDAAGAMPTHDAEGRELEFEIGLSVYKGTQGFHLQEAPESAPAGQIPRMVEVVCEGDLCDKVKCGDRMQVIGVYRAFPPGGADFTDGKYPCKIVATSVRPVKEILDQPFVTEDVKNIIKVSERDDTFALLGRSFAPSICGHVHPKMGLLLQMIGGVEKNLANGTHLRGDINVLLIGDPSCGKSQMLRFVMNTAPLAVSTTGRGSSGVGLTAAITREPGSKDFTLEAGAMVLADRGFICIDEFDKMALGDRTAIHEAMEQQCVTIAKAGMHVTLNTRCSVVAAANPVYGTFDPSMDLAKNIGLPDSLLSRFDLVFVVRDNSTEEIDRKIASQVLGQLRQRHGADRRRGVEQTHSSLVERRADMDLTRKSEASEVFEKTYGANAGGEEPKEVLTLDFFRKYIKYCRRFNPKLSPEAQSAVADRYVDMRMRFQSNFSGDNLDPNTSKKPRLAVTTRTLEALIRLATAHARLKLREDTVLVEDVTEAYKIMLHSREEPLPKDLAPASEEPPAAIDGDADAGTAGAPAAGAAAEPGSRRKRARGADSAMSQARLERLALAVSQAFASRNTQEMSASELLAGVNAGLEAGETPFGDAEFKSGLGQLEEANKVMTSQADDTIYLVG